VFFFCKRISPSTSISSVPLYPNPVVAPVRARTSSLVPHLPVSVFIMPLSEQQMKPRPWSSSLVTMPGTLTPGARRNDQYNQSGTYPRFNWAKNPVQLARKITYYVSKDTDPANGCSKIFGSKDDVPRDLLIPMYCEGELPRNPRERSTLSASKKDFYTGLPGKMKQDRLQYVYSDRENKRLARRKKQGHDPEMWSRLSSGGASSLNTR
jgi:hypothetical protein